MPLKALYIRREQGDRLRQPWALTTQGYQVDGDRYAKQLLGFDSRKTGPAVLRYLVIKDDCRVGGLYLLGLFIE